MPARRRRAFDWSTALIAALVIGSGTTVYLRDGRDRFVEIFSGDLTLFFEMMPKTLAGCLVGAFIALLLPREVVGRWVGADSKIVGLLIATVAGAILPGGPFTIFPVAAAFAAMGADIGAIVAFITGWSMCGYSRALVWELPFFGLHFVGWRVLLALPLPLIAGLTARYIVRATGYRLTP
jgi:uncharacterized membrane protein YraQ (UPF0718 family)